MQAVAAITTGSIRAREILKIKRNDFIKNWEVAKDSIFKAVDCLRTEFGVPVSQLLPYPVMVVPFAYFFHQTKNRNASPETLALLRQFFFWAGLNLRYTSAADSKIAEDLKKMNAIANHKAPKYDPNELRADKGMIEKTWFSTGNSFCKTVLCLLASQRPKKFDTNGDVLLDNSHLKIASSRNYHHFFPRTYIKKYRPGEEANWIADITLIDADSNLAIGGKAPSAYINSFLKTNTRLKQTLLTHLIGDPAKFGILTDNYGTFLKERSALIAQKLNEHLKPKL